MVVRRGVELVRQRGQTDLLIWMHSSPSAQLQAGMSPQATQSSRAKRRLSICMSRETIKRKERGYERDGDNAVREVENMPCDDQQRRVQDDG